MLGTKVQVGEGGSRVREQFQLPGLEIRETKPKAVR